MRLPPELFSELEKIYSKYWWSDDSERVFRFVRRDPFRLLVFTILSQNTSGGNAVRGFKSLASRFSIEPEVLANASLYDVAEAIRVAGLHRVKASRIIRASRYVVERFNGNLGLILRLPPVRARELLMEIPGVGPKTADVLLSDYLGYSRVIVVDTHMKRLVIRLGLADESAGYDEIQSALSSIIPWDEIDESRWRRIITLLWFLAKYTCRAVRPRCGECLLKKYCRFYLGGRG